MLSATTLLCAQEVPSFQFVNESLTKKANKPLGVSSYQLEQVVERMVRELEQKKRELGGTERAGSTQFE